MSMCLVESWAFLSHGHCSVGRRGIGSLAVRPAVSLLTAFAVCQDMMLIGENALVLGGCFAGLSRWHTMIML